MQVTARQAARRAARDESRVDTPVSLPSDTIRIEFGKPTPLDATRRIGAGHHRDGLDEYSDLAPARGMLTAVGLGIGLWAGIGLVVRALAF